MAIEDEDDGINTMIDYTQKVSFVRFLGDSLMPAQLEVKAEVLPLEGCREIDFELTFAKVKFWIENVVSRCVVFSRANDVAIAMMLDPKSGKPNLVNHLMITPYEPTDEHLAVLLQSKMAAISEGALIIGHVRVEAKEGSGLVFTYVGDWEEDLPKMADWFSHQPYWFDAPWWERADASTLDVAPLAEDIDLKKLPAWAFSFDFIDRAYNIQPDDDKPKPDSGEDVVIRGFRPKIISGGREED